MSDLAKRIRELPPVDAVRILNAIAKSRVKRGAAAEVTPDAALTADLTTAAGLSPAASATDGDVAVTALLLLLDNDKEPKMAQQLESMIENPSTENFSDSMDMVVGLGALVVLQASIKFERDRSGKWMFKFETQPLADSLLGQLISKLGSLFRK